MHTFSIKIPVFFQITLLLVRRHLRNKEGGTCLVRRARTAWLSWRPEPAGSLTCLWSQPACTFVTPGEVTSCFHIFLLLCDQDFLRFMEKYVNTNLPPWDIRSLLQRKLPYRTLNYGETPRTFFFFLHRK